MSLLIKHISLLTLFLGLCLSVFSQSKRQELESKKNNLKKEIAFKNKLLEETAKDKKKSLNQLVILNKKINEREELISTIKTETSLLDEEMEDNSKQIEQLEKDIEDLKDEYAELIRFAYKNRSNYEKVMYVFAADDFNQAYKRLKYLQEYTDYRKRQAENIKRMEENLRLENEKLLAKKEEKLELLESLGGEREKLASEKAQQNQVYSELQEKEKDLKQEIKQREKEQLALQKAIERAIEEEMRKARAEAGSTSKSGKWELTPEAKALAANFTTNKSKLPWPVEKGVITQGYGVHSHPVLTQIKVRNNGVTISTEPNSQARAVFEGEVSSVIVIPGAGKAVIVRHGDYLTVYGNLDDVYVSKGDHVSTKQALGRIRTDGDKTEIQFEIRKGQSAETLDPSYWLYNAR